MKSVLGVLLCFVFFTVECWAVSGGPDFGGGGGVVTTGTYAGVLFPAPTVLDPGPPPVTMRDNSLALFTLKIPREGLASGTSAVFRNGLFYPGGIQGVADPDSARLTGILNASFEVNDVVLADGSRSITAIYYANGKFANTKIVANPNVVSSAAARIRGRASLTYTNTKDPVDPNGDSGGPIHYKVRGFKQSETS